MAKTDLLQLLMRREMDTNLDDRMRKAVKKTGDSKPKSREKKVVGDAKETKLNGPTGLHRKTGSQTTQAGARRQASDLKKIAEKIPEDRQRKIVDLAKKRDRQQTRERIAGIYRENYMPADSYARWEEKMYGNKKKK